MDTFFYFWHLNCSSKLLPPDLFLKFPLPIRHELLYMAICLIHHHIQTPFEELAEELKHLPSYFLQ